MILKYYPALAKAVEYYCNFWIWILIAFFLNIGILFYINRYLKNKKHDKLEVNYHNYKLFHKDFILLFILTAVFMIWKTTYLEKESLDIMESFNIGLARELQIDISSALNNMISLPRLPLYTLVLNVVMRFIDFKYYNFFLRFLSVLFGIFTAYLSYHFSFRIFNSKFISYTEFIFLNIHGLFSFYSRRAEPYAMFCFLALLSYYYFWRVFISGEEKKIWRYCLVNITCFLVSYLTLVIIFSQLLTIFILRFRFKNYNYSSSPTFLYFIKAMIIFNFIIIVWSPVIYLALFSNTFVFDSVFDKSWGNNFYLNQENIFLIIDNIIKLILGLPLLKIVGYFFILLLPFIIFKLRKENISFYILIVSIAFSVFLFEVLYLTGMWCDIGRFYFNIRHFTWLIPFVAIIYGYGVYNCIVMERGKLINKLIGYFSFSLILIWNFYLTNRILLNYINPSYKKALCYIEKGFKKNDWVGWPVNWIGCCIKFNSIWTFNYDSSNFGEIDFGDIEPKDLSEKKLFYERIWVIIPWEDYFGVPHLNYQTLEKYINFLNHNLILETLWKGNKIDVYLFSTGRKQNH